MKLPGDDGYDFPCGSSTSLSERERLAEEYRKEHAPKAIHNWPAMEETFLAGWSSCLSHEPVVLGLVKTLTDAISELVGYNPMGEYGVLEQQAYEQVMRDLGQALSAYNEKRRAGVGAT